MKNKYIIVRSMSLTGPYIVERNSDAPQTCAWSKADITGYADTQQAAVQQAREANQEEGYSKYSAEAYQGRRNLR